MNTKNKTIGNTENLRKILYFLCSFSAVIALLPICCPSAIFRRIITIIVDPINAMFRGWTFSHISEKVFKRITPTITNSYSSLPIVLERFLVGIITSSFHTAPNRIFGLISGKAPYYTFFAMTAFATIFYIKATTTFSVSAFEIVSFCYCSITTIALTKPISITSFCEGIFYYQQHIVTITRNINSSRHNLSSKLKTRYKACLRWITQGVSNLAYASKTYAGAYNGLIEIRNHSALSLFDVINIKTKVV